MYCWPWAPTPRVVTNGMILLSKFSYCRDYTCFLVIQAFTSRWILLLFQAIKCGICLKEYQMQSQFKKHTFTEHNGLVRIIILVHLGMTVGPLQKTLLIFSWKKSRLLTQISYLENDNSINILGFCVRNLDSNMTISWKFRLWLLWFQNYISCWKIPKMLLHF